MEAKVLRLSSITTEQQLKVSVKEFINPQK